MTNFPLSLVSIPSDDTTSLNEKDIISFRKKDFHKYKAIPHEPIESLMARQSKLPYSHISQNKNKLSKKEPHVTIVFDDPLISRRRCEIICCGSSFTAVLILLFAIFYSCANLIGMMGGGDLCMNVLSFFQ